MDERATNYKIGNKNNDIIFTIKCNNSKLVEDIVKYKLDGYKYEKNKELFDCDKDMIIKTIKTTIKELKNGKITIPYEELMTESDIESDIE